MKKFFYLFFVAVGVLCLGCFVAVLNNRGLTCDEKVFLSFVFVAGAIVSGAVGILGLQEMNG